MSEKVKTNNPQGLTDLEMVLKADGLYNNSKVLSNENSVLKIPEIKPVGSELQNTVFGQANTGLTYDPEYAKSMGVTEDMFKSYTPQEQLGIVESASGLKAGPLKEQNWFEKNKIGIGAGLGALQLGLGYANYRLNKKGLESSLASARQERDLLAKAQVNRENIASKARQALSFA